MLEAINRTLRESKKKPLMLKRLLLELKTLNRLRKTQTKSARNRNSTPPSITTKLNSKKKYKEIILTLLSTRRAEQGWNRSSKR